MQFAKTAAAGDDAVVQIDLGAGAHINPAALAGCIIRQGNVNEGSWVIPIHIDGAPSIVSRVVAEAAVADAYLPKPVMDRAADPLGRVVAETAAADGHRRCFIADRAANRSRVVAEAATADREPSAQAVEDRAAILGRVAAEAAIDDDKHSLIAADRAAKRSGPVVDEAAIADGQRSLIVDRAAIFVGYVVNEAAVADGQRSFIIDRAAESVILFHDEMRTFVSRHVPGQGQIMNGDRIAFFYVEDTKAIVPVYRISLAVNGHIGGDFGRIILKPGVR